MVDNTTPTMSDLLLATFEHTPDSLNAATSAAGAAINKMIVDALGRDFANAGMNRSDAANAFAGLGNVKSADLAR